MNDRIRGVLEQIPELQQRARTGDVGAIEALARIRAALDAELARRRALWVADAQALRARRVARARRKAMGLP